ncbi:hypothetical protein GOODEAATRI_031586, partial [Goodea atripinnis]
GYVLQSPVGRVPRCDSPRVFIFSLVLPLMVPDTWLFGRAAAWILVRPQQQQRVCWKSRCFSSRSGWQGHTGAQTVETTSNL